MVQKASEIDQTLAKTAKAEAAKQLKSLEILEGKLMRAEKQRHEVALNQIRGIKEKLFLIKSTQIEITQSIKTKIVTKLQLLEL